MATWSSERTNEGAGISHRPRFLAFYLPQFHPIPENDAWWGRGFTEWTSVTRAKPRFRGHYQPRLPQDLGFYDLRLSEVRHAQAELARSYGVDAFCYYHYWFNGRQILERPFTEVLHSNSPSLPFCLCWANEDWTREWDGSSGHVLIRQEYSEDDDERHAQSLLEAWADPRYVRIDGRPLFLVYRASKLPNPRRTTEIWREVAARAGISDLFLCRVESFPSEEGDPRRLGFDASVLFQPRWSLITRSIRRQWRALGRQLGVLRGDAGRPRYNRMSYSTLVRSALALHAPPYPAFPGVAPGWDNSPRRRRQALIVQGATPNLYAEWLRGVCANNDAGLVFITAWNEWAEGSYLEPDQRWGSGFLEAHRAVVSELERPGAR